MWTRGPSLVVVAVVVMGAVASVGDVVAGTLTGRVLVMKNGKPVVGDDVWVYVEDLAVRDRRLPPSSDASGRKLPTREIRQVNEQFLPRVLVVPLHTTVTFPNFDAKEHNVFSPTDPGHFDLGRHNQDYKGEAWTFEDLGEMKIFCDIHKGMSAWVKVVDASHIAPVKNGQFTIASVPPGTYKVHAWVHDSVEVIEKVTVSEGTTTVTELHLQLGREAPHKRQDKSSYPLYP
ncbi:MAG: hypothetical protein NT062_09690 [Proteobacteria bacterium]|nr:hypothetical protein [Pseudomonadota bacterium]